MYLGNNTCDPIKDNQPVACRQSHPLSSLSISIHPSNTRIYADMPCPIPCCVVPQTKKTAPEKYFNWDPIIDPKGNPNGQEQGLGNHPHLNPCSKQRPISINQSPIDMPLFHHA
ncbi:hypothetical protein MAP00_006606 [Monascus purpureus]|nr:hypothetical protein MAP00_006606 [Monascus purpureus]